MNNPALDDKTFREQKKRVQKLIKKWTGPIGLHWWRIEFVWWRESCPEDASGEMRFFDVIPSWEYRDALVNVYLPATQTLEDERLEYFFVHELAHILTAELNEEGQKHRERVATDVAKALIWAAKLVK